MRLTRTEWSLLEAFAGHPGKLLTHSWLLEHVWGEGYADDVDVLRVFVSQLRKKIEEDPAHPTIILTEPGVGYRWVLRPGTPTEPGRGCRTRRHREARSTLFCSRVAAISSAVAIGVVSA